MSSADDEFRDFVAGFAEPLTKLAGLLIASSPEAASAAAAERLALRALARMKREWHDVASAPESRAVEVLLSRLPRAARAGAPTVVDFPDDEPTAREVKAGVWRVWCVLEPQHRVPLIFADPSIASRRLDGIELPSSFASERKLRRLTAEAAQRFDFALGPDDTTTGEVGLVRADWLAPTLADVAARFAAPFDAGSRIDAERDRQRWRSAMSAAAVIAVLAAASVVAVNASQPKRSIADAVTAPSSGEPAAGPRSVDARTVMDAAVQAAHRWQQSGAADGGSRVTVMWSGVDPVADGGAVLRIATPPSELVVVTWSSVDASAPQSRAYRVNAASSDTPFAFFYAARDGSRVGVLAPHDVTKAALIVDGVTLPAVPTDGAGFASIAVRGQTGLLAEQSITVRLFDRSGKPISELVAPAQPMVGGGGG